MILSIQSHVAYGYVGNRVATFILQRLGFDVVTLNTVQFSNHTGYGSWEGEIFSKDHLMKVLDGLDRVGALSQCTALLTGYLGSPDTASVVLDALERIQSHSSDAFYLCDPVMGDVGRGLFVHKDLPTLFQKTLLPKAFCMTPNLFELELLTNKKITGYEDLKKAMLSLPNPFVIVTSIEIDDFPLSKAKDDCIHMMMKDHDQFYHVSAPKLFFHTPPNGAGDAVSALFLGYFLKFQDAKKAFEAMHCAMMDLFNQTHQSQKRELSLVQMALS